MNKKRGPVVIELDEKAETGVLEAPPIDDVTVPENVQAMERVGGDVLPPARKSRLLGWFVGLGLSLVGLLVSAWLWELAVSAYMAATPFGMMIAGLVALFVATGLLLGVKELFAILRIRRVEALRGRFEEVLSGDGDLTKARHNVERLKRLYAARPEAEWGMDRVSELGAEIFDADALMHLAEDEIVQVFDNLAVKEIEASSRRVATITAIVPLALVDVATAFWVNLRMIRRIAEIYGGRSGFFSSWRLLRAVIGHIAATGAVAIGDDLISSVAGGGVISKISRRFGEGVINGALTARVGIVAMDVCRPIPFGEGKRPKVRAIAARALTGLFNTAS